MVHQAVGKYSKLFLQRLRRNNYVTPKNYLDFVNSYLKLLEVKDKFILSQVFIDIIGILNKFFEYLLYYEYHNYYFIPPPFKKQEVYSDHGVCLFVYLSVPSSNPQLLWNSWMELNETFIDSLLHNPFVHILFCISIWVLIHFRVPYMVYWRGENGVLSSELFSLLFVVLTEMSFDFGA